MTKRRIVRVVSLVGTLVAGTAVAGDGAPRAQDGSDVMAGLLLSAMLLGVVGLLAQIGRALLDRGAERAQREAEDVRRRVEAMRQAEAAARSESLAEAPESEAKPDEFASGLVARFCAYCASELTVGSKRCDGCGAKLRRQS